MWTLDEWKAVLSKDLSELKQPEGRVAPTSTRRSMKHQERPALPAWAGESFDDLELASLKQALGPDEAQ